MKLALVDMDGVLTDFVSAIFNYFWTPVPNPWPKGKDVIEALGRPESDIWGELHGNTNFWTNMLWMPDGQDILAGIEARFDDVIICSKPSSDPQSAAGKIKWLQTNLPKYRRKYSFTPMKELYAREGVYLFDDTRKNVDKFQAAGGTGVLIERPWNALV